MITLTRDDFTPDGIFGTLTFDNDGSSSFVTLEHAYEQENGTYAPKLPAGTYQCVLGNHTLHSGPVTTYEVQDVPGHSGILCCHIGNYNKDSEGCVLIGLDREGGMISHSGVAFGEFMKRLAGVTAYQLVVS